MFNWADYAIIAIIVISTLISLVRGFIKEAMSLLIWVIAFWVAFRFGPGFSNVFQDKINDSSVRLMVAFGILFFVTLLIGAVANFLICHAVSSTKLTHVDRFFGVIFGALRGLLIVTLLILLASFTSYPEKSWWTTSILIPHFEKLAQWIQSLLPHYIATFFSSGGAALPQPPSAPPVPPVGGS